MRIYEESEIKEVIQALNDHHIVSFPTDTVYGVGVKLGQLEDLERLKKAKNRPETKAIPVMVSSIDQIGSLAVLNDRANKIAQAFLPGPLTLILESKLAAEFTNGMDSVAIRIPDHSALLEIIEKTGPLFVTSANQSGQVTALTFSDALEQLPKIDGILKGECRQLEASTIVDTRNGCHILREGPITLAQLEKVL